MHVLQCRQAWADRNQLRESKHELKDKFDLLDLDGSGALSLEEFTEWMIHADKTVWWQKRRWLRDKLEAIFKIIDADGDDEIDKKEVFRIVSAVPGFSPDDVVAEVDSLFAMMDEVCNS